MYPKELSPRKAPLPRGPLTLNREESEKRRGELSSLALRFALDSPSDWRISSQVGRNRGNGMKKGKRDREKGGRSYRIRRPIISDSAAD